MKIIRKFTSFTSIQYISDIHLEYSNSYPKIIPVSENLALLGDIGNPSKPNYEEFLKYCSKNFKRIYLIAGNHEYWLTGYQTNFIISKITSKYNNIQFLKNSHTYLNDYAILGSTLWTKYNVKPYKGQFDKSVLWLKENINKNENNKTLVLTHYLPSFKLITPEYSTKEYDGVRQRYATDLEYLMTDNVKFWISGHSHCQVEMYIKNTFCGINAIGPVWTNYRNISKIIELT